MTYPSYDSADSAWEQSPLGGQMGTGGFQESTGPWPLAGQIAEMLGEGCEVDASFFEDSWSYGLEAAVLERRRTRDTSDPTAKRDCSFAELNGLNAWSWIQVPIESSTLPWMGSAIASAKTYAAERLQGFSEEMESRFAEQANEEASTVPDDTDGVMDLALPLTMEKAYKLLHLPAGSEDARVKAAYRKLVTRWHPDLFEDRNVFERAHATECMATINAAYQMLRGATQNS